MARAQLVELVQRRSIRRAQRHPVRAGLQMHGAALLQRLTFVTPR